MKMSTKCTVIYLHVDDFEIHLYDDFAGNAKIEVWSHYTHIEKELSYEELQILKTQLKR